MYPNECCSQKSRGIRLARVVQERLFNHATTTLRYRISIQTTWIWCIEILVLNGQRPYSEDGQDVFIRWCHQFKTAILCSISLTEWQCYPFWATDCGINPECWVVLTESIIAYSRRRHAVDRAVIKHLTMKSRFKLMANASIRCEPRCQIWVEIGRDLNAFLNTWTNPAS